MGNRAGLSAISDTAPPSACLFPGSPDGQARLSEPVAKEVQLVQFINQMRGLKVNHREALFERHAEIPSLTKRNKPRVGSPYRRKGSRLS